jgi:hypothetical protein
MQSYMWIIITTQLLRDAVVEATARINKTVVAIADADRNLKPCFEPYLNYLKMLTWEIVTLKIVERSKILQPIFWNVFHIHNNFISLRGFEYMHYNHSMTFVQ